MPNCDNTKLETSYKNQAKIKNIAVPPTTLPNRRICNDREANIKMREINQDIYDGTKNAKSSNLKSFVKWFSCFVFAILAYLGIRKFF